MKILYDDLIEFSEIAIRCNDTVSNGMCSYCPFYDRCQIDDPKNRQIQRGELSRPTESKYCPHIGVGELDDIF